MDPVIPLLNGISAKNLKRNHVFLVKIAIILSFGAATIYLLLNVIIMEEPLFMTTYPENIILIFVLPSLIYLIYQNANNIDFKKKRQSYFLKAILLGLIVSRLFLNLVFLFCLTTIIMFSLAVIGWYLIGELSKKTFFSKRRIAPFLIAIIILIPIPVIADQVHARRDIVYSEQFEVDKDVPHDVIDVIDNYNRQDYLQYQGDFLDYEYQWEDTYISPKERLNHEEEIEKLRNHQWLMYYISEYDFTYSFSASHINYTLSLTYQAEWEEEYEVTLRKDNKKIFDNQPGSDYDDLNLIFLYLNPSHFTKPSEDIQVKSLTEGIYIEIETILDSNYLFEKHVKHYFILNDDLNVIAAFILVNFPVYWSI